MAERQAARLLRPWLLSSTASLRPLMTPARILSQKTQPAASVCRHFSVQTPARRKYDTTVKRRGAGGGDKPLPIDLDNVSILIPMTFVAPPLRRWPRDSPVKFAQMAYAVAKNKLMNWLYMKLHKIYSKPSWRTRALFKPKKAAIVPTARDLHARMNAAIARGDKDELRRVCTQELYQKLAGVVDARPRGQSMRWELVSPPRARLTDDKIAMMPLTQAESRTIRQAIVTISSTQRVSKVDNAHGGLEVPGSVKTKDMVEHLVLTAFLDDKTWQSAPWKIWGTLPETTLEGYQEEVQAYEAMSTEQNSK
ncbi:hypothetical protein JX265_008279 [Neoarthrinium moseri]|uniref:Tim44-like domain-containing protein n=1 Tax=Neoarthrinium moseri TaxID=1658444 RepID=A0A9Q0AKD3_9PEZI|nr:uncharacterized protein JN550_004979 [Neoarthrinium moseri]KAI1851915.1 hypothetical protein JX266_002768 [Neoarthrinium moseri]KAI1865232.1 hypothetical protein JX265_008279 [Neoarthrinium moseri]KAI1870833.1 hypothetical protein JN550_004979 [Neoarthrinium moseri]